MYESFMCNSEAGVRGAMYESSMSMTKAGVREATYVDVLCLDLKRVSTACMGVQCPWLKHIREATCMLVLCLELKLMSGGNMYESSMSMTKAGVREATCMGVLSSTKCGAFPLWKLCLGLKLV